MHPFYSDCRDAYRLSSHPKHLAESRRKTGQNDGEKTKTNKQSVTTSGKVCLHDENLNLQISVVSN